MKRYLVFCGSTYYPCGGWDDFNSSWDTEGEAKAACKTLLKETLTKTWTEDWAHYVDLKNPEKGMIEP